MLLSNDIPVGTKCGPILADLFVYSYELESLLNVVKEEKVKVARYFPVYFSSLT